MQQFGKHSKQPVLGGTDRAVIYTRVSTKEQAETNHSLELQKKKCSEFAAAKGYAVIEYFGGTYESAKSDERKEFTRMLKFVQHEANRISYIIVLSADRFSRTGGEAMALAAKLRKTGVLIATANHQVDTRTTTGQTQQDFDFMFGHIDNRSRAERAILGTKERLRNGYWTTRAPLGYTMTKQGNEQVIVINDKGKLLRQAFRLKLEGQLSNMQLVIWLRKRGVKLSDKLLSQTFRNPFYCGYLSHSLLDGEVVQGKHEGLITVEQFKVLNNLQQAQEHGHTHAKEVTAVPLKKHVACHRCNKPLTGYEVKKKQLWYYKCNTVRCKLNIGANQLHRAYSDLLGEYVLAPHLVAPLKTITARLFQQLNQESSQQRKAVQNTLKQVQKKLEVLEDKYIFDGLEREVYEKRKRKLITEELQPLEAEYARMASDLSNLENHTDFAVELASKLLVMWQKADLLTRQQLQRMIHPNGLAFAPEIGLYRTGRANAIFHTIASTSASNSNKKPNPPR